MKRLLFILCLGCLGLLQAQNVWQPLNCNTFFLGADSEGNLFAMAGYGGLIRSQDEGATWTQVNDYYMCTFMAFSPNGRLFVFPSDQAFALYSEDHGDTWQQTASHAWSNYSMTGAYAVNNDTLLLWSENHLCYTIDAGATWNIADMSFLGEDHGIGAVIANEAGDVYASKWTWSGYESGIFHSTLSDMQNWEMAAFEGAVVLHMEFDPEGNVVAGSSWGGIVGSQHEPGFYLLYGDKFIVADNGIIYDLYSVSNDYNLYLVLRYSADHGVTFYEFGEALPIQQFPPGGEGDGYLWKGLDGHLYFEGNSQYRKSVFNTHDIHYIEGEVIHKLPACGPGYNTPDRFAILTDDNATYCLSVDGFWPNPFSDTLVVRYDSIPLGAVIGVFGTANTMVEDFGDTIQIIEVQQTTAHYYDGIICYMDEFASPLQIHRPVPPYETYTLTHNGVPMTSPYLNGVYFAEPRFDFVGHCGYQTDPYGNQIQAMELQRVIPFDMPDFHEDGYLTTSFEDPLCLSYPCEDRHYLAFVFDNTPYYLTHKGGLFQDNYMNNEVFGEHTSAYLEGVPVPRFDVYGQQVMTLELSYLRTEDEATLTGTVEMVPTPNTGSVPPLGLQLALVSNGVTYYINNGPDPYGNDYFLAGNDTVYVGQEITASFTAIMGIDNAFNFVYHITINEIEHVTEIFPLGTEWFYEIQNPNGSVTYQHLEYASDTAVNSHRAKVLIRSNTLYDKNTFEDITHEYIYEDGNRIFWWNSTLQDFTLLYDFDAEVGDEWIVKVENENLTLHVDAVEFIEYEGETYRVLHVSDPDDYFTGDIVCGIGHLSSFFPERLMESLRPDNLYSVDGLRCYWQDGTLMFKIGEEDCDAIYDELHEVPENPSQSWMVYPNPTKGTLVINYSAFRIPHSAFHITNLLGQTVLSGSFGDDGKCHGMTSPRTIDVSSLTPGIYFITLNGFTQKLIIQ